MLSHMNQPRGRCQILFQQLLDSALSGNTFQASSQARVGLPVQNHPQPDSSSAQPDGPNSFSWNDDVESNSHLHHSGIHDLEGDSETLPVPYTRATIRIRASSP